MLGTPAGIVGGGSHRRAPMSSTPHVRPLTLCQGCFKRSLRIADNAPVPFDPGIPYRTASGVAVDCESAGSDTQPRRQRKARILPIHMLSKQACHLCGGLCVLTVSSFLRRGLLGTSRVPPSRAGPARRITDHSSRDARNRTVAAACYISRGVGRNCAIHPPVSKLLDQEAILYPGKSQALFAIKVRRHL